GSRRAAYNHAILRAQARSDCGLFTLIDLGYPVDVLGCKWRQRLGRIGKQFQKRCEPSVSALKALYCVSLAINRDLRWPKIRRQSTLRGRDAIITPFPSEG